MTKAAQGVEIVSGEALVWSEPAERAKMAIQPGDIHKAISWFEKLTGRKPKLIMLLPNNYRRWPTQKQPHNKDKGVVWRAKGLHIGGNV